MNVRLTKHRPAQVTDWPEDLTCPNDHPLKRTTVSAGHVVFWCEQCRRSGYATKEGP